MRILQVITDTDRRGAQVFATDLEEALGRLGHEVDTVALTAGKSTSRLDVDALGPRRLAVSTLRALRERLGDHDIAVAHGSSTGPACALAGTATPFVYRQISDSLFWAPTASHRWRVRGWLKRAAAVVALSQDAGSVLATHFGVSRSKLFVIPNGVPRSAHRPADDDERHDARRALSLDDDVFVMATVAALVPEKGVDLVIDAVEALPETRLLVAGDGPERSALERQATARAPDRVRFLGSVADLDSVYDAADVVVLASQGGDSMPASLIEAGFRRLPVIATDVGAIGEIVLDGQTGVVLAEANADVLAAALRQLVADPQLVRTMGDRAERHCAERFDIDVVGRAWASVLERSVA